MATLTDWIRAEGLTLPPIERWGDVAPDSLSLLDPLTADVDAVFLGEMNHFIHEKADFRLLLIRYLAARGITRLAEECSWSDGVRIARYLRGADAALDRIAGFGWEGDKRTDRDDGMKGAIAGGGPYPTELFAAEQTRFYDGLRAAGLGRDFYGIDVDAIPGGAYADIAERFAPRRGDPAIDAWLAALARVPGESQGEEAARLRGSLKSLGDIAPKLTVSEVRAVGRSIAALAETLDYIVLAYDQPDYAALAPGLAYREDILKRQALAALAGDGERAPTIFMAHGLHLLKDDRLGAAAGPAGPGGGQVSSLGHFLAVENGLRTCSIWMMFGAGEDSQPFAALPRRFAYAPGTLNRELSAVLTAPTLIPITGAPSGLFDRPWRVGHMYNAEAVTRLDGQVHAIPGCRRSARFGKAREPRAGPRRHQPLQRAVFVHHRVATGPRAGHRVMRLGSDPSAPVGSRAVRPRESYVAG